MENPLVSHYTVEELFMLKPETIEWVIEEPVMPVVLEAAVDINTASSLPVKDSFWPRHKWYIIIGGIMVAAGISWMIYRQYQKKKKVT